jgi:hypothetical protein
MVRRGDSVRPLGNRGLTPIANSIPGGSYTNVSFTPSFTLPAQDDTVRVELRTDLNRGWIGVACALINETTGGMYEFIVEQDKFHEGGSPSAATRSTVDETVGALEPGQYSLRLDPRWARKTGSIGATIPPAANIRLTTVNSRDGTGCCCIASGLLFLPVPLTFLRKRLFEGRRWRNSNV